MFVQESLVVHMCSPLPASAAAVAVAACSCVPQHRGLLVRVVPIKESHTLEIQWDIPPSACQCSPRGLLSPAVQPLTKHPVLGQASRICDANACCWVDGLI
jgi:hypothetical protein